MNIKTNFLVENILGLNLEKLFRNISQVFKVSNT